VARPVAFCGNRDTKSHTRKHLAADGPRQTGASTLTVTRAASSTTARRVAFLKRLVWITSARLAAREAERKYESRTGLPFDEHVERDAAGPGDDEPAIEARRESTCLLPSTCMEGDFPLAI
jgi:hypothetical protein